MNKRDAVLYSVNLGQRLDESAEKWVSALLQPSGTIQGISFESVEGSKTEFLVSAHQVRLLARYEHVIQNGAAYSTLYGRFRLVREGAEKGSEETIMAMIFDQHGSLYYLNGVSTYLNDGDQRVKEDVSFQIFDAIQSSLPKVERP